MKGNHYLCFQLYCSKLSLQFLLGFKVRFLVLYYFALWRLFYCHLRESHAFCQSHADKNIKYLGISDLSKNERNIWSSQRKPLVSYPRVYIRQVTVKMIIYHNGKSSIKLVFICYICLVRYTFFRGKRRIQYELVDDSIPPKVNIFL